MNDEHAPTQFSPPAYEPLVALWTFRLVVHFEKRVNETGVDPEKWWAGVSGHLTACGYLAAEASVHPDSAQEMIAAHEKRLAGVRLLDLLGPAFTKNVRLLQSLLGLNQVDVDCLSFLALLQSDARFNSIAMAISPPLTNSQANIAIATALGVSMPDIQAALSTRGNLISHHLIERDSANQHLPFKFNWALSGLAEELFQETFDPVKALSDRIVAAPPPTLQWGNFAHLGPLAELCYAYTRKAVNSRKRGVNLLIHGEPGVGKTEFVRVLAQRLECELFEVVTEDRDGDPIEPLGRLRAVRLLHQFCRGRRCLVVFDEAEDVFPAPQPTFGGGFRQRPKGWVNRLLESNQIVTAWLTNCVKGIDPAFGRRFDLVVEMKRLGANHHASTLKDFALPLPAALVDKIANTEALSPAVLKRSLDVVASISGDLPEQALSPALESLLTATLQAQGHKGLNERASNGSSYDSQFTNCSPSPECLLKGIRSAGSARILFSGPPGTGKTETAIWLAQQLGRPCHQKKCSDLLGPYVGSTERAISEAFRSAADAGAVLLFDEVDSFLSDRAAAQRQWEVTQVNEFLTQLEAFNGIVIATTNLRERLDAAAARRFDLKAVFTFLTPTQSDILLDRHCGEAGLKPPDSAARSLLRSLTALTPGDFACLARRQRFAPLSTATEWIAALANECASKPLGTRAVRGFSAT